MILSGTKVFVSGNPSKSLTFSTLSGDLVVTRDDPLLTMDFPVGISQNKAKEDYAMLIESLGEVPGVDEIRVCPSLKYLMIRLKDGFTRTQFESWRPDVSKLERSLRDTLVVVVTTRGTPQQGYHDDTGSPYDFVCRCFAPWINIPEDPVTGSAQTILAHYWAAQLGNTQFYTRQCSPRGGDVRLRVEGERVKMSGSATIVLQATLFL